MLSLWGGNERVHILDMGSNLFRFSFNGDVQMNRVLQGEPWLFDGSAILLRKWASEMSVENVVLEKLPCWVLIWNLPFEYIDAEIGRAMGTHIREVLEVDTRSIEQDQGSDKFNNEAQKIIHMNKYDSWMLVHGERRLQVRCKDARRVADRHDAEGIGDSNDRWQKGSSGIENSLMLRRWCLGEGKQCMRGWETVATRGIQISMMFRSSREGRGREHGDDGSITGGVGKGKSVELKAFSSV
ncbi:hypothetical protein LIER_03166 [Lithospermum erythrorhizon]|uniref:DUF4283 domain-containing protein n=1 Tax=Lithospermum erythrorhizon TaxID=34254 RepID=A0AAV3NTP9_LITER